MKAPFEVGDVVEVISDEIIRCGNIIHLGKLVAMGKIGRISNISPAKAHGSNCRCMVLQLASGIKGVSNRFRKIDSEVTEDFRQQMRELTKKRERTE